MKLIHPTLAIGMSSALLFGTTPGVSAQAQLGVHGNLSDVVDFNWGVGGRLGFFKPAGSGMEVGLEATYSVFFPDCGTADCDSSGGHAALIAAQDLGGGASSYLGLGTRYQKLNLTTSGNSFDGDDWGFLVLFGTKMESDAAVSPFFEVGWSWMNDIENIWDFTLGARIKLGG